MPVSLMLQGMHAVVFGGGGSIGAAVGRAALWRAASIASSGIGSAFACMKTPPMSAIKKTAAGSRTLRARTARSGSCPARPPSTSRDAIHSCVSSAVLPPEKVASLRRQAIPCPGGLISEHAQVAKDDRVFGAHTVFSPSWASNGRRSRTVSCPLGKNTPCLYPAESSATQVQQDFNVLPIS